jgi:hypothetical protein
MQNLCDICEGTAHVETAHVEITWIYKGAGTAHKAGFINPGTNILCRGHMRPKVKENAKYWFASVRRLNREYWYGYKIISVKAVEYSG